MTQDSKDIRSLTDFRNKMREHIAEPNETSKPIVLTLNEKGVAVLVHPELHSTAVLLSARNA